MTVLDFLRAHPGQPFGAGAIMFACDMPVARWTVERRELEHTPGVTLHGAGRSRTYAYTGPAAGPAARPDVLTWRARNGGTEWVATTPTGVELCVFPTAEGSAWNGAVAGSVVKDVAGVRTTWPSRELAAAVLVLVANARAA